MVPDRPVANEHGIVAPPSPGLDVDNGTGSLDITPGSGSDPYRAITKDNIHAITRDLFDRHYNPDQIQNGIPDDVDPYLYDYALSLYLSPADYKAMHNNVGRKYLFDRKKLDSYIQQAFRTDTASNLAHIGLSAGVQSLADVALTPVNSAISRAGHALGACSRDKDSAISCGLDVLSNTLYASRDTYRKNMDLQLPLTAWLNSSPNLQETIRRFPYYKAMRDRIYEAAIPMDSHLRWAPGNGARSGKLKPQWVLDLSKSTPDSTIGPLPWDHWTR